MMKMRIPALALALAWLPLGPVHAADDTKPNIVVILVDDLGSGDVSCFLRQEVKTPNIDRLAKSGVKFSSGYVTHSLCGPSRAALFSGVYPQRIGFRDNAGGIPATQPLLPGVLRDAGYRTALIGKWHSKGPMPHERGCFDETLCSAVSTPFIDYFKPKLARNGKVETFNEYSTDLFAREATEFIDRNRNHPFALTVTFNAPHIRRILLGAQTLRANYDTAVAAGQHPDVPKDPTARPGEAAKFAEQFPGDSARADTVATITALDEAVGRILDKLQQCDLEKKTIVFFLADNGGHPENRSENQPLRDYKWSAYEGGLRVPFLASYPGVFPAGIDFPEPVSSLDIFATCAALTGAKAPAQLDGVDLTPFLKGENKTAPHDALFFHMGNQRAVRQGQWKLVFTPNRDPELFDLSQDIAEKTNLAATNAPLVQAMIAKWNAWDAQMPPAIRGAAKPPKEE
jgi:arylsulfatase A-like enzyme